MNTLSDTNRQLVLPTRDLRKISTCFKGDSFRETHLWEHFGRTDKRCSQNVSQKVKHIRHFSDKSTGAGCSGPKKSWQPETWQDFTHFSPPWNQAIFSTFWGAFLLDYTETLERREKNPLERENSKSPVETAPRNCRFLSLVMVERVLSCNALCWAWEMKKNKTANALWRDSLQRASKVKSGTH